ncbi:hypothetical protein [Tenacibaculum maritimum]|uniref:hypothetical protein n=1 Tax=Tenacibaculum maritimum TaxID=107401 RepID=UPI001E3AA707|nr:hypothetical protein [Tenacibaculum maritimum]MCD9583301.1 hypothetical protein [Tenacibaculum maritimum]MCD9637237.1 hypothetical protein [Tenacibaculum maritimum]
MITIVIPIFSLNNEYKENENVIDIRRKLNKIYAPAISFYKKYIGIKEVDYEYFLVVDNFKVEVNFGLLKEENEIQSQLKKAEMPLIKFTIDKNMLSFVRRIYNDKVEILSLKETFGGYELLIKDPFNNTIQIECENFEDENLQYINTSEWNFYSRM